MSDALKAIEADAATGPLGAVVPLVTDAGDFEVTVPPAGKWKTRATKALREGDFDAWAELVMSADDYDTWVEADPTNDNVESFFQAWAEESGQNVGKSSRSANSSRSTRKR